MSKKKLGYRNFNICQLVDNGKLKLQYLDEFKGHLKRYTENTSKINNVEKRTKKDKINIDEQLISIPYIPEFPYLMHHDLNINHGYIDKIGCELTYYFLKENVKFIGITKEEIIEYAILIMDGFIFGNDKLKDINILEMEDKYLEDVEPYLIDFNMVKSKYTHDDLIEILDLYIKGNVKNKVLIKEK